MKKLTNINFYFKVVILLLVYFALSYEESKVSSEGGSRLFYEESISEPDMQAYVRFINAPKIRKIDSLLERSNKYFGFNGAVLVSHKGKILLSEAYGYKNFDTKEELSPETPFQLASVSKQFTAVAILMLKERGELNLDDPITKYLPELPYPRIKIRHLLNHTSGLPNYMWLAEHKIGLNGTPPNNEEIVKLMARHKLSLYFSPGRRHFYSNTGYVLLASIVERISGEAFNVFMENNIFQPLDMKNTYVFSNTYENMPEDRISGYNKRWRGYYAIGDDVNDGPVGDKGIYSSVTDLYKWDQALYTEELLSKETLDEAFTKGKTRYGYPFPYGFGFRIDKHDGKDLIYHHGLWHGFRTSILRYVEDSASIILVSNTNCQAKNVIVNRIEKLLFQEINKTSNEEELFADFLENGNIVLSETPDNGNELDKIRLAKFAHFLRERNKPYLAAQFENRFDL